MSVSWDQPPRGLVEPWLSVWKALVVQLRELGLWSPALWPHAVEYVHALRLAVEHRVLAEIDPVETNRESGLTHMHAGFADARAYGKRATELADLLGVSPRGRKQLAALIEAPEQAPSIADRLDELAQRREKKRADGR